MKTRKSTSIGTIVRQYKAMKKSKPDRHIDHCVAQTSLIGAIEVAAKAIDDRNKRHGHQCLISKINLSNFAEKLKAKEQQIKTVKSFDDLMTIIESEKSDGIGELAIYDTATRIGAYLNLFPDRVYLHSGTRKGARNLLGQLKGKKYLALDDFPKEMQQHGLTASEIEDILCIFKDNFKN